LAKAPGTPKAKTKADWLHKSQIGGANKEGEALQQNSQRFAYASRQCLFIKP
jgi:hypothetical protein